MLLYRLIIFTYLLCVAPIPIEMRLGAGKTYDISMRRRDIEGICEASSSQPQLLDSLQRNEGLFRVPTRDAGFQ